MIRLDKNRLAGLSASMASEAHAANGGPGSKNRAPARNIRSPRHTKSWKLNLTTDCNKQSIAARSEAFDLLAPAMGHEIESR